MRGRLHLLSRKCHVWIWKVVCPWTCLAAECVQACKKHRTASSCLVRVVRGLIGGISCDGLGLGRVLCRMETDLIGGRVIGRSSWIGLIDPVDQISSHVADLGFGWCLWKTSHIGSCAENWHGNGISIHTSLHPRVVEVVWEILSRA